MVAVIILFQALRPGPNVERFDASEVRRLTQLNLGRPKLDVDSSHEKFDVWPSPLSG